MHGVYCGNTCNSCSVHYPRSQYRSDDRGGACTCRTDNRFCCLHFSLFHFVRLLLSEKAEAKFSRIDKRPNGKFRVAYYMVNGQEYPNIFPEEGVFRASFTKQAGSIPCGSTEAAIRIRQGSPGATTAAGFVSGIILTALAVWALAAMWEV